MRFWSTAITEKVNTSINSIILHFLSSTCKTESCCVYCIPFELHSDNSLFPIFNAFSMDSKFLCCFVDGMFLCIPYSFFFKFDCVLFMFHAKVRIRYCGTFSGTNKPSHQYRIIRTPPILLNQGRTFNLKLKQPISPAFCLRMP